jgi:hypothetical protein
MSSQPNPQPKKTAKLRKSPPKDTRPIWEVLNELAESIPQEELDKIPHDGSINYRHYLYGHPKVEG